jgi:hypothetical protein
MYKQAHCELIDQLCSKLGVENPQSMYGLCSLQVNGIDFTLLPGSFVNDDTLIIYCDLGAVPAERKLQVLERLMEVNFHMFSRDESSFACNPETGRVLLVKRLSLSETNLQEALRHMAALAAFTFAWRERFLMSPEEWRQWKNLPLSGSPEGVSGLRPQ